MLVGLEGVIQIKDDIVVHGQGQKHDENLRKVLKRLDDYGLRFRKEKCEFGQPEIVWFGHTFTKHGMSPDPEKVQHIKQWPVPKDNAEVKSLLQTVQFCAPYMRKQGGKTHSDFTAPLRHLTKHEVEFKWTRECQISFNELKNRLTDETVLVNYDPNRDTRLYVDHGPLGIASTVAQRYKEGGQDVWKAVYHNGRRLEPAEQRYPKVDGESLAIYSGINMNRRHLYGIPFVDMTDHSALLPLYKPSKVAPARVGYLHKNNDSFLPYEGVRISEIQSNSEC